MRDVLLVGSVALDNAEAVMALAAEAIGPALKRIPDGETGPRAKFITWQAPLLASAEQFEMMPLGPQSEWGPNGEFPPRIIKLKPGATGTPKFPPTGYADVAIESYRIFARLKSEGRISQDVRFQVGLPTPLGVLATFMEPDAQAISEPVYRERIIEDIDRIAAEIPHSELCIQWDIPEEVAVWEDHNTTCLDDPHEEIVDKLAELMNRVPSDAELGLHLCYGDISHKHWKEPDLGILTGLTNAVVGGLERRLDYVHLPIPRDWKDEARYRQLSDFDLPPETEVFLGLVHATDGVDGARTRIAAAKPHLAEFGVGTSCGLGRRDPADIPKILELHKAVAELG